MSKTLFQLKIIDPRVETVGGGTLPKYAQEGDSGFSLRCLEDVVIDPGQRVLVKIGYAVALPVGKELQIRSRSGNALKKGVIVLNQPGTVDACYRGEVGVLLYNTDSDTQIFEAGEGIAQGVIADVDKGEYVLVKELSLSQRGEGGFGSTGAAGIGSAQ